MPSRWFHGLLPPGVTRPGEVTGFLRLLGAGALGLALGGCRCGTERPVSFSVYVTEDQLHALPNDAGGFEPEACTSLCAEQGRLEDIDDCEATLVEPASGAMGDGASITPGVIWVLRCQGTEWTMCK